MCYFLLIISCLLTSYLSGAESVNIRDIPSLEELALQTVVKQLKTLELEQLTPQSQDDTQTVIDQKYTDIELPINLMEECAKRTLKHWPVKKLIGLQGAVREITFDEHTVTAYDSHRNLRSWNLDDFSLEKTEKIQSDHIQEETSIQSSAENSRYLVTRNQELTQEEDWGQVFYTLNVFDKEREKKIASHSFGHTNTPHVFKFTQDGQLCIGTERGDVLRWNFTESNAQPECIPRGSRAHHGRGSRKHTNVIYNILQTPTKKHLYSFSKDNTVRYGSITPSSSPVKITSHSEVNAYHSTISTDGILATGGWDNAVNVYEKGEITQTVHTGEFTTHLAFSADMAYLAIGGGSGKVTVLKNPGHLAGTSVKTLAATIIQQSIDEKENQATPNTKKRFHTVTASIKSSLPTIMQPTPTSKRRKLNFEEKR